MASLGLIGFWISATLGITFSGVIYIFIPSLPQAFQDLFLYGKCRGKRKEWTFIRLLEVPKSWFCHFYMVGVAVNSFMLYTVLYAYILGQPVHPYVTTLLQLLITKSETNIGAVSSIVLIGMIVVQNIRRLFECLFVSVYSKGTINLAHYLIGIIHYADISFAILCEAPNLATYRVHNLYEELCTTQHMVALGIFLWASWNHHLVTVQFANLRKDKQGKVSTYQHQIPHGGWFDYTSCPHYFFEIMIYLSFLVITTFEHHTFWVIIIFVLDNQIISGYISHLWYLQEFKDYPKNRAAVVPFIL